MSDRVLSRVGARELTPEEWERTTGGGSTTGCFATSLHKNGPTTDFGCDPN